MATDRIDEERVMTKWLMGTVIVALVATGGCSQRFETESDYVAFCTGELAQTGLKEDQSEVACNCMYRQARAAADKQEGYAISEAEFEVYFDQCMAPVFADADASAAWESDGSESSAYDDSDWGGSEAGSYSGDWGD